MSTYPRSPKETTRGLAFFPRMLDKIRLHARGELGADYHENLGTAQSGDGMCCNLLRIIYEDLRVRTLEGGSDEKILDWCFKTGRALNEGDIMAWNGFLLKLGWNDFASGMFEELKKKHGIEHRTDIATIPDLIDFDEGRLA